MRAIVAYCSQTGSAEMYAHWLAEDLECRAVPIASLEREGKECDTAVLCSWFHAASIKGAKEFQAYMAAHPEKTYAVVAVGATPMPCEEWPASEHEKAFRRSFPTDRYPDLLWCYCQGGFHFDRLGAFDKMAMRVYFRMLEKSAKDGCARSATALENMKAGFDGCDRSYLEPVLQALRSQAEA